MKLRQLRQFVTLAETGNFHRAAEQLHMAQPPLSVSIRKLEEELGSPLFDRTTSGVLLTPAGEAMLEDARSALLHADDVLARPGGEEFTVFLPATDHAQALQVGARVCQRVRDADIAHLGSPKGRLTVSVGVATLQPGDADLEDVLRRADAALYRVKAAGRDGVGA